VIELFLREELISMAADDGAMRERLVADGSLFDGYNPLMAIVHRRNGDRLSEMVDAYGWPGATMVGEDGADAAWLVLHHAIGDPALQRRCLPLLEQAAAQGEIPAWHPATLLDGIRFYEGRPQVYGSMFDWDESGRLVRGRSRMPSASTSAGRRWACRRWPTRSQARRRRPSGRATTGRPTPPHGGTRPHAGRARSAGATEASSSVTALVQPCNAPRD
jgi:hypothetical protein